MNPALPIVDLFAGAGGLSTGLDRAGFEPVLAVESDTYACETYSRAHPAADLVAADIRQLSFKRLRGQISVVAGGPPCQPFSTGGLGRGARDPRDGFPAFLRAVAEIEPEAVLIENVAGLARGRSQAYLGGLVRELADLGFLVSKAVLAATDYGVPQRRERLFIMGTRRSVPMFPPATHGPNGHEPWIPAGKVLDPDHPVGPPNAAIVTYARRPDVRPSPYDGLLFNGGGRPIDLAAPARTILASAGGNKTPFIDVQNEVPAYHAALLRGEPPRRGILAGARRITVAESAALQTIPAGTEFAGPQSAQYRLVGNAVPPLLAEHLGHSLARALAKGESGARAA